MSIFLTNGLNGGNTCALRPVSGVQQCHDPPDSYPQILISSMPMNPYAYIPQRGRTRAFLLVAQDSAYRYGMFTIGSGSHGRRKEVHQLAASHVHGKQPVGFYQ